MKLPERVSANEQADALWKRQYRGAFQRGGLPGVSGG